MHFYTKFYYNTLKYDLINVFKFKLDLNLPKLKTVILNLQFKACDIKKLAASLFAFELIAQQWGQLLGAWKSKVLLKIRKGSAIGCKLTVKKRHLFSFFNKTVIEIFSKLNAEKIQNSGTFQVAVQKIFNVNELKNHYNFFYGLNSLKVVIVITPSSKNSIFLFKSLTNYLILIPCQ